MKYFDKATSYLIADSSYDPLRGIRTAPESLEKALSGYILSASGWRNIFAASKDEEDAGECISDEDAVITALIAKVFFDSLRKKQPRILLALDARPTGRALGWITLRILTSLGAETEYLFISAAPETMAYSHQGFDAFCYISASHNPVGHNGFKFGCDGGVYERSVSDRLAEKLRQAVRDSAQIASVLSLCASADQAKLEKVLEAVPEDKEKALTCYRDFVLRTAGVDSSFRASCGIVGELNGSARCLSIDERFLSELGCRTDFINSKAGCIVHAIVPEGENLVPCASELEKAHSRDSSFILGYCPDNDGDRGNFAYINAEGKAEILQAQEVFAFVVAAELADLDKKQAKNLAVAVNCPTSERIDAIAACFNAKVFRAEVGEANVVSLAAKLRQDGCTVHVLGEGSNGGNITDPAKVRDPLNSIMTVLKLISDRELYAYAVEKLTGKKCDEEPSIAGLIRALPVYTTTGAFSSLAKMHVKHTDWAALKTEYERLFVTQWEGMHLESEGITGWTEKQTEGIREVTGSGAQYRSLQAKGGLKMVLLDADGNHAAYMWLRPSGTESVLRVLVDVKGRKEALHDRLLSWQRSLIEQADRALD